MATEPGAAVSDADRPDPDPDPDADRPDADPDTARPDADPDADPDRAADADRARRRLAEVFGDDLPTVTSDETDAGEPGSRSRDEQLLADRPPHHDRG